MGSESTAKWVGSGVGARVVYRRACYCSHRRTGSDSDDDASRAFARG